MYFSNYNTHMTALLCKFWIVWKYIQSMFYLDKEGVETFGKRRILSALK